MTCDLEQLSVDRVGAAGLLGKWRSLPQGRAGMLVDKAISARPGVHMRRHGRKQKKLFRAVSEKGFREKEKAERAGAGGRGGGVPSPDPKRSAPKILPEEESAAPRGGAAPGGAEI